jgi:hypothetical protein
MSNAPFRAGSKASKIVEIMTQNANTPMEDVLKMIMDTNSTTYANARADYQWMVRRGYAPGEAPVRGRQAKPVTVKPVETAEDILRKQEIKARNLELLKSVGASMAKRKVRDYGGRVARPEGDGVEDYDPALAREEVNAILRDERLIDVCPKFVRDDM